MKFRAVIESSQYMREFQHIIVTLSKLSKECIMIICADKINFIVNEKFGRTAPLVWATIDAQLYFSKFTMHGLSEQYPQIILSLSAVQFARAIAVIRQAPRFCKLKLTNVHIPCLKVEAETLSQAAQQSRQIVHEVPVKVIDPNDWDQYAVPQTPLSKLVLNIPINRLMRSLIDKMKHLSRTATFHMTSEGELNLVAETDMATITTRFKHLEVVEQRRGGNGHLEVSCEINSKKMAIFIASLQVATPHLSCGINNERSIHLMVNIRKGVVMHSIIPAVLG